MKLSIIVPVYNTERWLSACLDSLLIPNLADYEVVAVNDGSTDASGEILSSFEKMWPDRLRVVNTPNGGLGHARNCGIEAAEGQFTVFVDSDDWLAPNAVSEMLQTLETDFDIAVFDLVHVDEQGKKTAYISGCEKNQLFSYEDAPEFLFSAHNAVNKIWKRTLFTENNIRFPDRMWFEDLATTPKLYLHATRIFPVHRPWYCYLQRTGSIMNNTGNFVRNMEIIEVADSVVKYYRENDALDRFFPQLEYKFFYEEYLAGVNRVNRQDPTSSLQGQIRDDYLKRFPDYRSNPYVRSSPMKYHVLDRLIRQGNWKAVHSLMGIKTKMKGR